MNLTWRIFVYEPFVRLLGHTRIIIYWRYRRGIKIYYSGILAGAAAVKQWRTKRKYYPFLVTGRRPRHFIQYIKYNMTSTIVTKSTPRVKSETQWFIVINVVSLRFSRTSKSSLIRKKINTGNSILREGKVENECGRDIFVLHYSLI